MKGFVTQKEHQRRLATIVACAIIDTIALVIALVAWKGAGNILEAPNDLNTIKKKREKIAELRAEAEKIERNFVEFSQPIGWRILSDGTYDRFATGGTGEKAIKEYLNLWVRELERGYNITEFKPYAGQQGSGTPLLLTELFNKLQEKEAAFRAEAADLLAKIEAAEGAAKATGADIVQTEVQNLKEIDDRLVKDYLQLEKDLATRERQHAEELSALETEVTRKQQELSDLRTENGKRLAEERGRLAELGRRLSWLQFRREEAKERKEPDATIVAVDHEDGIVHIDLVRADRLFKGTRFKVYSLEKGGVKRDKGEIEVLEVRDARSSRAAIVKTARGEEPMKEGDRIYNESYERGKVRRWAFAGRLAGKLSNDDAARKLREFGDLVQPKVDETTNYLIVGEGYAGADGVMGKDAADPAYADDHPGLKAALDLGVRIILERHLYDYLGIP